METFVSTTVMTSVISDLYKNIRNAWTHNLNDVTQTLCNLDLVAKIELVEACLDVTNDQEYSVLHRCARKQLVDILKQLHDKIDTIHHIVKSHNDRTLLYRMIYRSPNVEIVMSEIVILSGVLDRRIDTSFKIQSILA